MHSAASRTQQVSAHKRGREPVWVLQRGKAGRDQAPPWFPWDPSVLTTVEFYKDFFSFFFFLNNLFKRDYFRPWDGSYLGLSFWFSGVSPVLSHSSSSLGLSIPCKTRDFGPSVVAQWVKPPPGCWFKSWLLLFWFSSLLMCLGKWQRALAGWLRG